MVAAGKADEPGNAALEMLYKALNGKWSDRRDMLSRM
jgi:hypothetical protein